MLGAYTPTKLFPHLEVHVVYRNPVAGVGAVIVELKTSRATCRILDLQPNLAGVETFGRLSKSGKLVLSTCRLSAAKMEPLAEMDRGFVIVVMGVSGAGKSTVGELLSKDLGCPFIDADDFHPAENKEKMRNGIPLTEDDRLPWLEKLRDAIADYINNGETAILACSALRRSYRHLLSAAAEKTRRKVVFVHLTGSYDLFASRLAARHKEGKHFMPPSLLRSQLDILEEGDERDIASSIVNVDASLSPHTIVNLIKHGLYARHNL